MIRSSTSFSDIPLLKSRSLSSDSVFDTLNDLPTPLTTPRDTSRDSSSHIGKSEGDQSSLFEDWEVGSRYQLTRNLGHGSYGDVVEAIDTT